MVVACHLGGRLVHRMAIVRLMSMQVGQINATERRNWRAVRTAMNATYGMYSLFSPISTKEFEPRSRCAYDRQ